MIQQEPILIDLTNDSEELTVEDLKKAADNFYASKRYSDAIEIYTNIVEKCPSNFTCYGNRAACYIMLNQYKEALKDAQKAVEINPKFYRGYIRIAKCAFHFGNFSMIESTLLKMESLNDKDITFELLRNDFLNLQKINVRLSAMLNEPETSRDYRNMCCLYDQILIKCPNAKDIKIKKAETLVFLNRIQEAVDIVDSIWLVDNNCVDAVYVKGLCLLYQDAVEKAQYYFQYILKLAPDYNKAIEMYKKSKCVTQLKTKGNDLFKAGKYVEAIGYYNQALAIDPFNSGINAKLYCNRGLSFMSLNKLTEAINDFSEALKLDKNYLKALQKRAKCYHYLQDFENAIRDYEKLTKMDKSQEYRHLIREAKFELKKMQRKDYYKVLGVNKNATAIQIKQAYRKKALECHPDKHAGLSAVEKTKKEKMFKEIGEAYGVLSDSKKKHDYDNGADLQSCPLIFSDVDPFMTYFFNQAFYPRF